MYLNESILIQGHGPLFATHIIPNWLLVHTF
jgi:hypothetical protein